MDYYRITFDREIQLNENHKGQLLLEGEIIVESLDFEVRNYNITNKGEQSHLIIWFDGRLIPKGHTYTLHLSAGCVADLDDATVVNEELNIPLIVPANLNHYFRLEWSEIKISEDSPKTISGCNLHFSTDVNSTGSPVIYLKRNGETIGEYPICIKWQDWDYSTATAHFPEVTLDEGAEYTLVLPANSCCSQYRSDLTNDELTIVIQEGSSAISEVELTEADKKPQIFDLQGRRLVQPTKGINIINGKKVLIK